jgi:hypothetical protein
MNNMLAALHGAGLVSEKTVRDAVAEQAHSAESSLAEKLSVIEANENAEREKRLDIMRKTRSPRAFRMEAHKLLLLSPSSIHEVVELARGPKLEESDEEIPRRKLITQLLKLNDRFLSCNSDDEKRKAVKETFPKH